MIKKPDSVNSLAVERRSVAAAVAVALAVPEVVRTEVVVRMGNQRAAGLRLVTLRDLFS